MALRAAIYARISKDEVGRQLGVDRQLKVCRKLARDLGVEVVDEFVDNDRSAFSLRVRRPGFERLVEAMKDGRVQVVIAYHPDRVYRRLSLLESIINIVEATGVEIRTVAAGEVDLSTASGRFSARVIGAAAQHESERTSERIKMQVADRVEAGAPPPGVPPYGYARGEDGGYVVDREQAKVVRRIAKRILEGASLMAVARELEDAGMTTQRGGARWPATTVRSTVLCPAVAGLRTHNGQVTGEGKWAAILDRPTWEAVCAVVSDPARKRTRPVRRHLLSGFVFDTQGLPMMGVTIEKGGERRPVYRTHWPKAQMPRAGSRVFTQIGAEDLEAFVVERVFELTDRTVVGPAPAAAAEPGEDVVALEAEELELARLRGEGVITIAEWMAAKKPLERRLQEARKALAASARGRRQTPKLERLLGRPGALRKAWGRDELTLEDKREVLGVLVEKIVVQRTTKPARWVPVRDRIEVEWRA